MIPSLLNTSYYLYHSPTHFLLTSCVSFYLVTHAFILIFFPILFNLPDCVMPWLLNHLDLLAIAIVPLNTETREYSALLASQQACQPVNLLDGHAACQSSCFCVKTLIKKSHPWSQAAARQAFYPLSFFFFLIGPHMFSVSFSAFSFKLIHFQQNWKTALIRNIINFFLRTQR